MPEAVTAPLKYIYLDVVGFTTNRTVEAQSDIVAILNTVVLDALKVETVPFDRTILLPTGDGLCIALVNVEEPFDVHIRVALSILTKLAAANAAQSSPQRQFTVRIGINTNIDNLVTDVNGNRNVAGAGINLAARVMSLADGNQILVSDAVYHVLKDREAYQDSFRAFVGVVKHDLRIRVYQLIRPSDGLHVGTPHTFQERIRIVQLSDEVAFYLGTVLKFSEFVIANNEEHSEKAAVMWLWYRAQDALEYARLKPFEKPRFNTHGHDQLSDLDQLRYYESIDFSVAWDFVEFLEQLYLGSYEDCFEAHSEYRVVSAKGLKWLLSERPEVVAALKIERPTIEPAGA